MGKEAGQLILRRFLLANIVENVILIDTKRMGLYVFSKKIDRIVPRLKSTQSSPLDTITASITNAAGVYWRKK